MKNKLLVVYDAMVTGGTTTAIIPLLKTLSYIYDVDLLLGKSEGERIRDIPSTINLLPQARIKKDELSVLQKTLVPFVAIKGVFNYTITTKKMDIKQMKKYILNKLSLSIFSRTLKEEYDVVIGFIEGWADQYVSLCSKSKKKIVWIHAQIDYITSNRKIEDEWMKNIDKFVFVTKSNKDKFDIMYPEYSKKSIVFENIVDDKKIKNNSLEIPNDEKYREFLGFGGIKIITVCRLTEHVKGIDRVVKAAKLLKEKGICFKWYVLGDGRDRETVRKKIKDKNVGDCLVLLGNINNPYPYVKAADIFVLLSRFEGKPICITESLLLGTPTIVTNYPSAREQVHNGENGFIIENDDASIEEFMLSLANQEINYVKLKDNLQKHPFVMEDPVGDLKNLIEE